MNVKYTWSEHRKRQGSFFVGVSPAFDMAVYTVCFLLHPNRPCQFNLAGVDMDIQTYDVRHVPGFQLAAAFPVVWYSHLTVCCVHIYTMHWGYGQYLYCVLNNPADSWISYLSFNDLFLVLCYTYIKHGFPWLKNKIYYLLCFYRCICRKTIKFFPRIMSSHDSIV